MIPYLIIGTLILIGCSALVFVFGEEDSHGERMPDGRTAFVVFMMMLAIVCFLSAKNLMYHNIKDYRIETVIKTKSIDGVAKSDTLIRIIRKK